MTMLTRQEMADVLATLDAKIRRERQLTEELEAAKRQIEKLTRSLARRHSDCISQTRYRVLEARLEAAP